MRSDFRDEYFRYETRLGSVYYLGDLVQKISLEDSIDEVGYRATFQIVATPGFPQIVPGQEIEILDTLYNNREIYLGIIHEVDSENRGLKDLDVKAYCYAKFLESEDEFLLPADMTASTRFQLYARAWGVPLGSVADTGQLLDKAVYRPRKLGSMIKADLEETAKKNGKMYTVRSNGKTLDLVELGTNDDIPVLVPEVNIEKVRHRRTLLDKSTKVKYVGKKRGGTREPVYGGFEKDVDEYGTHYRIQIDDRINTPLQANAASERQIVPVEEIVTVYAADDFNVRAGDAVSLAMTDESGQVIVGYEDFLIINLKRQLGNQGHPGHYTLELGYPDYVRRKYYLGESVYSPSTGT